MNSPSPSSSANVVLVPRVIWGALFLSLHMYLFVLFFVRGARESDPAGWLPDFSNPVHQALSIVAIFTLAASFVVPKRIGAVNGNAFRRNAPDASSPEFDRMAANHAFVPFILRLALSEAVMLMGFVIAFTDGGPAKVFPFYAAAAISMLMAFPVSAEKLRRTYLEA